ARAKVERAPRRGAPPHTRRRPGETSNLRSRSPRPFIKCYLKPRRHRNGRHRGYVVRSFVCRKKKVGPPSPTSGNATVETSHGIRFPRQRPRRPLGLIRRSFNQSFARWPMRCASRRKKMQTALPIADDERVPRGAASEEIGPGTRKVPTYLGPEGLATPEP